MKRLYFIFAILIFISCVDNETPVTSETKEEIVRTSDSVTLSYKIYGSGDTTLLFLHGWAINKSYWDSQVEFFSPAYKIVTVDLAGFGESDTTRRDYQFDRYAKDISELITQLELKNVVLIGHSMSGDIILETAIAYPQHLIGLIGIDNFNIVGKPFTENERKEVEGYFSMFESNYKEAVKIYAETSLFHSSTDSLVKERVKRDMSGASERIALNSFRNIFDYLQEESEKLPLLKLRLNLLNSDAHQTDAAALAKFAGASYKIYPIPATGHYPMIEKSEVFNAILADILNDIAKP